MKKLTICILTVLTLMLTVIPVSADGLLPRLYDGADLLSDGHEADLLEMLDEISERQQVDIVIHTVTSLDGYSAMEYTDERIFEDLNYGYGPDRNAIILMVCIEEREWYVTTAGFGITAMTDAGLDYMAEDFVPLLSDEDYMGAFMEFALCCDIYLDRAYQGDPFDVDDLPKAPFNAVMAVIVSLVIGLIVALIYVGKMKSSMKTVLKQAGAKDYVRQNSMNITESRDYYLYRNVTRSAKSDSSSGGSSTHTTSSGTRVGGGGGKF